jgi:hypothetical protein
LGPPGADGYGVGGGFFSAPISAHVSLLNTIIGGNTASEYKPDVRGYLVSLGGNLVQDTNGLTAALLTNDIVNTSPLLSPLQNNGGPIPTHAWLTNSPALDAGLALGAPALDARGVIRPQGQGVDIGAYEWGNQAITFPTISNLIYGAAPFELSASSSSKLPLSFSVLSGPASLSSTNNRLLVITGVGTVTVVAAQAGNEVYLPAPNVTNSFVVGQAPLLVSAPAGASRPYGETNPVFNGTVTGAMYGDNITATFVSTAAVTTPVGTYPPNTEYALTPLLNDPDSRLTNYMVTTNQGALTISKASAPLIFKANDASRPYGETNPFFSGTISNLLNNDAITAAFVSAATLTTPAGIYGPSTPYAILPQISDPNGRLTNYNVVTNAGTITITRAAAALYVAADNATRPYGATNPIFNGTLSNVLSGDNITATFVSTATTNTPAGVYDPSTTNAILPQLSDPDGRLTNYTVVSTAGTLTITKAAAALYVAADSATRPYGATNPVFTGTLSNVLSGDNITATFVSAATTSTPAGVYDPSSTNAILPQLSDPDGRLSNYTVVTNAGTLTITKAVAALYAAADDASRPYGANNPIFTGTLSNVLSGDNITATFVSAATTNTPAGVYGPSNTNAITPRLSDPDGRLVNYTVVTTAGTLTITKAAAALYVTANNATRPYGAANPVFTGVLSNLLNGDNITATFISAATTNTPVGVYGLSSTNAILPRLSDPDSRLVNYTVVTNVGTFTIAKATAPIIVTAHNASRRFGRPNPVFTGTLTNVLCGDRITATYSSAATPATPAGVYAPPSANAITPHLADPDGRLVNYTVVANAGTLTILPYNPPTVRITSPTNGSVFLVGMDILFKAEVTDPDGIVTNVYFLDWTNRLGNPIAAPPFYYMTVSNLLAGDHRFTAEAVDDIGRTNRSPEVNVNFLTSLPFSASAIDTSSPEVWQTGLYQQDCWVTNPTPVELQGLRVEVRGLTNAWLWNATGTNSGGYVPYIQYNSPIGAGQVVRLRLQYYAPDGSVPVPILSVLWLSSANPPNPVGTLGLIGRILPFANGTMLLNFTTLSNQQYYIQYTGDLVTWNTSLPAGIGHGGVQQWLDYGPPVTSIHPTNAPCRFYRLLLLPNN